jgi:pimeloyl-ACP methyl ester carboxylesterase
MSALPAEATDITATPAQHDARQIYSGETEVLFENDGQKVQAFEGSIEVSENRNDPDSRLIPVHYLRFPATGEHPGSPIIYLAGGPGGSGIATVSYPGFRFPLFMAMREFGDVIALDQRGTGKSRTAPECTSKQSIPPNNPLNEALLTKHYRLAAVECVDFWTSEGVDVLGYTTVESVRDIDQLRQHFNTDKVTLWGISYGSHLALASLKMMPEKIDKVIIASAEGLNQTVKLPARTDAYFARLQLAINQQPKAAETYPDIKALMNRVHQRLDDNPVQVMLTPEGTEPTKFLFQRIHMQGMAAGMIADPHRGVPRMLELYNAIDHGVTEMLPSIIERAGLNNPYISFDVMSFGMDIASGVTERKLQLVDQQSQYALLGRLLNFPMPQLNRVVDGLDLGDEFRQYPKSDVPTLLLTGTLDGRTYIKSQQEATRGLTNLTQVMVKNGGHNVFMLSPQITGVIQDFMRNKVLDTTEIEFQLPDFVQ